MPVFEKVTRKNSEKVEYFFNCPGCGWLHFVRTHGPHPNWQFNGDLEKPTVSPSILVHGQKRCHSFIKDGQIQFLNDCEHDLKGQTVPLPEFEW